MKECSVGTLASQILAQSALKSAFLPHDRTGLFQADGGADVIGIAQAVGDSAVNPFLFRMEGYPPNHPPFQI